MNDQLQLVSSNKTADYFKEWENAGEVLKKNLSSLQWYFR